MTITRESIVAARPLLLDALNEMGELILDRERLLAEAIAREKTIEDLHADNVALRSRLGELERRNAALCDDLVAAQNQCADRDAALEQVRKAIHPAQP